MSQYYQNRKTLRRSLLEKEFEDEYSLDPNQIRVGHDFGPKTYGMLDTVNKKRSDAESRHASLEAARAKTASLDPEKLLDNAFKEAANAVVDEEYEKIIERYRVGDHVLRNKAKEQMDDAELEAKMYAEAANTVKSSPAIIQNFDKYHIGEVVLPPPTRAHTATLKNRTDYITLMSDRLGLHHRLLEMKSKVHDLNESIKDKEALIGAYTVDIEKNTKDDHFDWLLNMHNKIRALKAEVAVEKEDLVHADEQLAKVAEEMERKYPDMSAAMSLGVLEDKRPMTAGSMAKLVESGVDVAQLNEKRVNASGEQIGMVYGWILGRINSSGNITHILFGQFTQSPEPPSSGWVHIGTRIRLDDYIAAAREERSGEDGEPEVHNEHGAWSI
jgi:hypothetical protein